MAKRNDLKSIRSDLLTRGLSLAKLSLIAGSKAAGKAVNDIWSSPNSEQRTQYLVSQIKLIADELGYLKGSLMKVGQLLSTYGEHFLPKEANEILKSLQFQSPPMSWSEMEKVLSEHMDQKMLAELNVESTAHAAASLGQVHKAERKSDGQKLAVKIQYPGVDKAIDSDLKILKRLLQLSKLLPKGPRYDQLFDEVQTMLHQEVDYTIEAKYTSSFRKKLEDDDRYVVPSVYPEYSSKKVITTEFMLGVPVDSPEVLSLSQERRNALGRAFLELYMRELFEFNQVQTDPHLGNYRVQIDPEGKNDKLVLLDFGAVRNVPEEFLKNYRQMIRGGFHHDQQKIEQAARSMGFIESEDSPELVQKFVELCLLITEPFAKPEWNFSPPQFLNKHGEYDWVQSDLPRRVAKKGTDIAFSFRLRTPPKEVVFLDRKLGGAFIFLSVLKCQMNGRLILDNYLA